MQRRAKLIQSCLRRHKYSTTASKEEFGKIFGTNTMKQETESMIRVDHAGEFGAIRICKGQMAVLKDDPTVKAW